MKEKDEVKRQIIRVAIAEIERQPARGMVQATQSDEISVIRKLIFNNNETIRLMEDHPNSNRLKQENAFLSTLLPTMLSQKQIAGILYPVKEEIIAAKTEGQAVGVAMKNLHEYKTQISGDDVKQVVQKIRG